MIVVVAGVSGSGKSTVGALLAGRMHWTFEDGDALHPAANVAKMRAGMPLTDEDRQPWLRAIGDWMDQRISAGEPAVLACSALKRSYRDTLQAGRPGVRLVFLAISREAAAARLAARHGHFFPEQLLDSQFRDLQPPAPDENVLVLDADQAPGVLADLNRATTQTMTMPPGLTPAATTLTIGSGDLSLLNTFLTAQAAVEAPRYQTRHLVSSFDNHAWNKGDLLLDERIPSSTASELAERGHRTGVRSR